LHGILANRSAPIVPCLREAGTGCERLKSRLRSIDSIHFISGTVRDAKIAAGVKCFDVVLFDQDISREEEAFEAIRGAKTVLITDVNTYLGHTIAHKLFKRKYRLVGEKILSSKRDAILAGSSQRS
jgi:hypothetical protein